MNGGATRPDLLTCRQGCPWRHLSGRFPPRVEWVPEDLGDHVRMPGTTAAARDPSSGQFPGDRPQACSRGPELPHQRHDVLLRRRSDEPVPGAPEAVRGGRVRLQMCPHVVDGGARPLGVGLSLPLRHAAQDVHQQLPRGGGGVDALLERRDGDLGLLEDLEEVAQVLHGPGEPVQLVDDHHVELAGAET